MRVRVSPPAPPSKLLSEAREKGLSVVDVQPNYFLFVVSVTERRQLDGAQNPVQPILAFRFVEQHRQRFCPEKLTSQLASGGWWHRLQPRERSRLTCFPGTKTYANPMVCESFSEIGFSDPGVVGQVL